MKKFSLAFLMIMFAANMVVVSAWAKPCMVQGHDTQMNEVEMTSSDMPPCHTEKEPEKENKYCDGICLCMHVAHSQTPTIKDVSSSILLSSINALIRDFINYNAHSLSITPLKEPPKSIS